MQKMKGLTLALGVVLCAACLAPNSGVDVADARPMAGKYSLAKTSSGSICVTGNEPMQFLCGATENATGVGWGDRFLGVQIDVPAKEFLLIDTLNDYVWVLSKREFQASPEAKRLRMTSVEEIWNYLGRHGV